MGDGVRTVRFDVTGVTRNLTVLCRQLTAGGCVAMGWDGRRDQDRSLRRYRCNAQVNGLVEATTFHPNPETHSKVIHQGGKRLSKVAPLGLLNNFAATLMKRIANRAIPIDCCRYGPTVRTTR
jgi:hypothetical protein